MKLQIFRIEKFLRWILIMLVKQYLAQILLPRKKKDENYHLQMFLKQCKYIEKKVIRHSNDNLSDFSSSDESDEE